MATHQVSFRDADGKIDYAAIKKRRAQRQPLYNAKRPSVHMDAYRRKISRSMRQRRCTQCQLKSSMLVRCAEIDCKVQMCFACHYLSNSDSMDLPPLCKRHRAAPASDNKGKKQE